MSLILINYLNSKYPGYLDNIDAEKSSMSDLTNATRKLNEQMVNRVIVQRHQIYIVMVRLLVNNIQRSIHHYDLLLMLTWRDPHVVTNEQQRTRMMLLLLLLLLRTKQKSLPRK